jgi:hypothetical protein
MGQPLMIFLILQKEGRREVNEPTSDDIPYITEGGEEGVKEGID